MNRQLLLLLSLLGTMITACNVMSLMPTPSPTAETTSTPPLRVLLETPTVNTVQPSPSPMTFIYPPTVTAAPSACERAPRPTRLVIMERGVVTDNPELDQDEDQVNVRDGPGTINPVIAQLNIGDVFLVIGGPECTGTYAWFQIQFRDVVGWIAEGDRDSYYVAPFLPG